MGEKRMYSAVQRANALSTVAVTNLMVFTVLLGVSGLLFHGRAEPTPVVKVHKISRFAPLPTWGRRHLVMDEVRFRFDMDADFRPLFHWNVKQIFVYITAKFPSHDNRQVNEIMLWNQIITSPKQAHIRSPGTSFKFPFSSKGKSLKGSNVTLWMEWNTLPYAGRMFVDQTQVASLQLPTEYSY